MCVQNAFLTVEETQGGVEGFPMWVCPTRPLGTLGTAVESRDTGGGDTLGTFWGPSPSIKTRDVSTTPPGDTAGDTGTARGGLCSPRHRGQFQFWGSAPTPGQNPSSKSQPLPPAPGKAGNVTGMSRECHRVTPGGVAEGHAAPRQSGVYLISAN